MAAIEARTGFVLIAAMAVHRCGRSYDIVRIQKSSFRCAH